MINHIKRAAKFLGLGRMAGWISGVIYRCKTKPSIEERRKDHPELLAVLPYCSKGKGIDVGCGNWKSHPNCIGVDILQAGTKGEYGCVRGRESVADICSSGDSLPMFGAAELDFVIARHNLEHYVDIIKTLQEWKRVLKPGGVMAVIVPDERARDTIHLDPTHKHVFTPDSFSRYLKLLGGLHIERLESVIEGWSFLCVARRLEDGK